MRSTLSVASRCCAAEWRQFSSRCSHRREIIETRLLANSLILPWRPLSTIMHTIYRKSLGSKSYSRALGTSTTAFQYGRNSITSRIARASVISVQPPPTINTVVLLRNPRKSITSNGRTFATSTKKNNRNKGSSNKKHNVLQASSTAGRIAMPQTGLKRSKSGKSKLCSGCGAEVIAGSQPSEGVVFSTGDAAVDENASKNAQRRARYYDFGGRENDTGSFLCDRCKALNKTNIWKAYDAIRDVDASVFAAQLKLITSRRRFGLCIVVADATDPEHSAPKNYLRRIVGKIPAILVLTKADLLPRLNGRDVRAIADEVRRITRVTYIETMRVSAHTGAGMFDLAEYLLQNVRGRDVFVVGSANVGKSTLVQKLAKVITPNIYLKGASRHAQKRKRNIVDNLNVTASHLPGTTTSWSSCGVSCRYGKASDYI